MSSTNGNGHIEYLKPVFHVTRDMSHLPRWKQWLFWNVFKRIMDFGFWLKLPVLIDRDGARLDIQSIADTDAIASAICAQLGPGSFYVKKVPHNLTLPKATVIFGGNRAPYSESAELYRRMGEGEVPFLCPNTQSICRSHVELSQEQVQTLYEKVKTAVAS